MFTKRMLATLLAAVALIAVAGAGVAQATPSAGVTTTTLGIASFDDIDAKFLTSDFQVRISTKGASDVQMLENRVAPGGSFGWHRHPGPSLVVVKSGTLTLYRADDPTCTPELVTAGHGFVDDGADVHLVRNEGSVEVVAYVMSIIPAGATRRIDQPAPSGCGADLR
jgi:quercetin dioxygenase-like cupin family protein